MRAPRTGAFPVAVLVGLTAGGLIWQLLPTPDEFGRPALARPFPDRSVVDLVPLPVPAPTAPPTAPGSPALPPDEPAPPAGPPAPGGSLNLELTAAEVPVAAPTPSAPAASAAPPPAGPPVAAGPSGRQRHLAQPRAVHPAVRRHRPADAPDLAR
ncbi:hypothetical protein AB0N76_37805, partial [Kitasatospora sp. NPDC093806]